MHYSKTLTEHDIKHIERHLSMKRTIRKKIMRDLQQAFVQVMLFQDAFAKMLKLAFLGWVAKIF